MGAFSLMGEGLGKNGEEELEKVSIDLFFKVQLQGGAEEQEPWEKEGQGNPSLGLGEHSFPCPIKEFGLLRSHERS